MDRDEAPRILLPRATAERLAASMSRRRFLAASGASAMALWLAACGSDSNSNNSSSGRHVRGHERRNRDRRHGRCRRHGRRWRGQRQARHQHVHLGRVRRSRPHEVVGRDQHHDLQLERGGDPEAGDVEGHQRLRHRRADRRLHPADGEREADPAPRPQQDRQLRQPRPAVHEPVVGPGQQVLGVQGLGHDRLDLRHDRRQARHHQLERLPRRGPEGGQRQRQRARHRRPTSPASTSGPTGSTGRPPRRKTSTPARTTWSTRSPSTSRPSTPTRASTSRRATTPCRRCSTATPARA